MVRAAGTWVPQDSNSNCDAVSHGHSSPAENLLKSHLTQVQVQDEESTCDRPFCKLKRKRHEHCELCNQGFTDAMKLKIHYLKHQQTKLGGFLDDNEEKVDEKDSDAQDLTKNSGMMSNLMLLSGIRG